MRKVLLLLLWHGSAMVSVAQEDTNIVRTMDEVVLSVSKWEQKLNEVPNKIVKLNKYDILRNNPQTAADLLGQSGAVFIQKSQLGGGSPMIRGFATNRVLLVVDGVRMNNAIYRSGNMQNVISIDALSTEAAEIIFGPGSLIYGSDAIGGVMDFHTLEPRFSRENKLLVKGSVFGRITTANREKTAHFDLNLGWKKCALLSSFSYSRFDDLKMGKNGGQQSYLRTEYVKRVGQTDSITQNNDPRIQRFSGYNQVNFLQKVRFKPNKDWDLLYSYTYANTGDAPRYDRLIQYRNGALRFAEWYYGPMCWQMHTLQVLHSRKNKLYDDAKLIVAGQDYRESRVDRTRNSSNRNIQSEKVDAISANLDLTKLLRNTQLFYGMEAVFNKVGSAGQQVNIQTGNAVAAISRYPDGSTWSTMGIYSSIKINPHPKLTMSTGLRYSYNMLEAVFDSTFIRFPFSKASLYDGALTGNAGLVFRPAESWQLNGNVSTGYRMPNVDDIGKLFESAPGNVTIPNPGLKAEYAWNFELGIVKNRVGKYRFELNGFFTKMNNAIARRPASFNGQDSILFEGVMSRTESLQNVAYATIYGVQLSADVFFTPELFIRSHANWLKGKETDDVKNEQVPLRHAPPFYGSTALKYRKRKYTAELSIQYNSQIKNKDLAPTEQAKKEIYAKDADGKPYSPGWVCLNIKGAYQIIKNLLCTAAWENMTNKMYRPYSSGIVAPGSNLILSLRATF